LEIKKDSPQVAEKIYPPISQHAVCESRIQEIKGDKQTMPYTLTDQKGTYSGDTIANAPQNLRRAETNIARLHQEIELYKKTWLATCNDIAELEEANRDRQRWSAAWKTAAQVWRKIARYSAAGQELLNIHIETQNAIIQDMHEQIGWLKAELGKHDESYR
jgi:chromosome segregation ATPase